MRAALRERTWPALEGRHGDEQKALVAWALAENGGHQTKAAELLGCTRQVLMRAIARHGLEAQTNDGRALRHRR